ncbi:MAG: hypothetical protein H5T43_05795 [Methanomethylovorans sp.]|jgi:hypothetical protein|nr:hypothetical protein [Methanomethylovorans sp.]
MENDSGKLRKKMLFAALSGVVYLSAGVIQFILSLYNMSGITYLSSFVNSISAFLFVPSDFIGSLILILIGTIFLYGLMEHKRGFNESIAYVYVGILISLIFMSVYLLVMTGNWLESYWLKDFEMNGRSIADDIRPAIYLGLLPLGAYFIWKNDFRTIDK